MFIKSARSYSMASGEQRASGSFLALFTNHNSGFTKTTEIRAFVRWVLMKQLGQWMMGQMEIPQHAGGKASVTLSGAYGEDGLTCDVKESDQYWDSLWPLPEDLAYLFWADNTGWNDAGVTGKYVHSWASRNESALRVMRPSTLKLYNYRLRPVITGDQCVGWHITAQETGGKDDTWTIVRSLPPDDWARAAEELIEMRGMQEPVSALARYRKLTRPRKRMLNGTTPDSEQENKPMQNENQKDAEIISFEDRVAQKLFTFNDKRAEVMAQLTPGKDNQYEIDIVNVRLRSKKEYCGNHSGPCPVRFGPERKHRRAYFLEGADWVEFNDLVNDVLDQLQANANVYTSVCWLRKGKRRRTEYGEGSRFNGEWAKHADETDYIDYCGREAPPSEFPSGTPGSYTKINYNVVG